jgi:hypothetical protein
MCKDKGFLAVDPDNVDGFTNANGFNITAADQLDYNRWLADTAHALGLAAGLKNDLLQIAALEPNFDFFVNEECGEFNECGRYAPAAAAGKPVFSVEYETGPFEAVCRNQTALGVTSVLKVRGARAGVAV